MNTETIYTSMTKQANILSSLWNVGTEPYRFLRSALVSAIQSPIYTARNLWYAPEILKGEKTPWWRVSLVNYLGDKAKQIKGEANNIINNHTKNISNAMNSIKTASVNDMCTVYTALIKQAAAAGAIVPGAPAPAPSPMPAYPAQQQPQQGATINDTNQELINSFNKMLSTVTKANETQAPQQPEQAQQQPAAPAALPTPPPFKPPQTKAPGLGNPVKAMMPRLPKAASAASADKEFGEKFNAALDAQKALLPESAHKWFETRMTPIRGIVDRGRRQALYDASKEQYGYGGIAGLGTAGLTYAGLGTLDFFKKHPGLRLLASGLAGAAVGVPLGNDIGTKSYNRQMGIVTSSDRA